jgi:hypothetical protein
LDWVHPLRNIAQDWQSANQTLASATKNPDNGVLMLSISGSRRHFRFGICAALPWPRSGTKVHCTTLSLAKSLCRPVGRLHPPRMPITVTETLKTVKFAALGVRNLIDEGESVYVPELTGLTSRGFNQQVVSKFAALGQRTLDL